MSDTESVETRTIIIPTVALSLTAAQAQVILEALRAAWPAHDHAILPSPVRDVYSHIVSNFTAADITL